jgi:hypothetical protein
MNSSTEAKRSIGSKVALVTAFVFILGGGTAFGAFVVSSNSQIGPNTVSGHKPPAGKHANIISGSVNGTDLAAGSVTSGKLGTGAVTNSKLGSQSVTNGKIANLAIDDRTIQGQAVTTADLHDGAVNNTKIGFIPQARVEFLSDQSIPDNTFTRLCYDTAIFDNDSIWGGTSPATCDSTGPRTKLIAPVDGVYQINASLQWANNSTGVRVLTILKNGTTGLAIDQTQAAAFTGSAVSTLAKLNAGDFVQANVLQNSGGALAAVGTSTTNFSMTWVGNG